MKTQSEQNQRWEDIIFEKRNKEYGAYVIRKSYDDRVLTGWTISIGIVTLIFLSSFLSLEKEKTIVETPEIPVSPGLPPTIKTDPKVIPPAPPAPKQVNQNLPPVATINPVIDEPILPTQPSAPSGTEGTGTPVDGAPQSGGVDIPVDVPVAPTYVLVAEVMPSYEGGMEGMMKFLQKKLRYPSTAEAKKEEGTVYVSFIINPQGEVKNVEVVKGFFKDCDKEAVRVVSMMNKWKPGLQNKMPVAVKMVLPIKFKLTN